MNARIRFDWLILYRMGRPFFGQLHKYSWLRATESPTYFNRISASDSTLYHPVDLEPTNLLHHKLRNALAAEFGLEVHQKNFPYEINIDSFAQRLPVGVSIQAFFPDLLLVRIASYGDSPLDEATVFDQRRLDNHPILQFIVKFLAKQAQPFATSSTLPKRQHVMPLIRIDTDERGFEEFAANPRFLVALLINDTHYRESSDEVFKRVIRGNAEHNQKGEKARTILLSKQGFLCLTTPSVAHEVPIKQEIKKKERLLTLGSVLSRFYDSYANTRRDYMREMDYLFFATRPYIKSPGSTFKLSYSNTLAWRLIMEEFRLSEAFEHTLRFDADTASVMGQLFDQIPKPQYAQPEFWENVNDLLGEDYVSKQSGGIKINIGNIGNIGTNQGAIATGPQARAVTSTFSAADAEEFRQIVEGIADLRPRIRENDPQIDAFDALITTLREEGRTAQPNLRVLRQTFGSLRNIVESTVAGIAAGGLLQAGAKLLGI